jgi:Phage Tail Collar Domain
VSMWATLGGVVGKVPRPSPAMVVALVALLIACSGAAFAAIPSPNGVIAACYDNGNATLRVIDRLEGQACRSTETELIWKDGIHGKVADSDKLDGMDSTDFLGKTEKATDSDKLDGMDSSKFVRASQFGSPVEAPRQGASFPGDKCAIGEVRLFAGSRIPSGWKLAHGQALSIDENKYLFAMLGTTYGGNGSKYFVLPDLRGTEPKGAGKAAPNYAICTDGYFP